jgi:histidinol-phosphate aminotransferase
MARTASHPISRRSLPSRLAGALAGQAVLVVDEAYGEYATQPSATTLLEAHANLAVLRTLSKAHALAGARIGTLLADPALVAVLRACQAPYPVGVDAMAAALAALAPAPLALTRARIEATRRERARLASALGGLPCVRRVYASDANFLLARFADASAALNALGAAGIAVRDQRAHPALGDALRITVGTPEENRRVIASLECVP